ncbi:unnamed protein product [Amoebophrya sp. A25]|nr:unnamed protein product [Amoebophrya sp. A25]|eukprot:GSA25T00025142001.1
MLTPRHRSSTPLWRFAFVVCLGRISFWGRASLSGCKHFYGVSATGAEGGRPSAESGENAETVSSSAETDGGQVTSTSTADAGQAFTREKNPFLLRHAMCMDEPFFLERAGSGVSPRKFVERCVKLVIMTTEYNYHDPEVAYCSGVVQTWADNGMARRAECFVDFCFHQLCLLSLIFYALYFFQPQEINEDMSLCTQSFLPFVAAVALMHDMGAHIKSRKIGREMGLDGPRMDDLPKITGADISVDESRALMLEYYLPEEEWVISYQEIRDMLDSRKALCQRLRQRQLREQQLDYAAKFALETSVLASTRSRTSGSTPPKSLDSGTSPVEESLHPNLVRIKGGSGNNADSETVASLRAALLKSVQAEGPAALQTRMETSRPLSLPDGGARTKHYSWVEWNGTNANPELPLRYRRPSHEVIPRLRIGIILGVSNAKEVLERYQAILNLWRCYANYHQFEFVMPTDDYNLKAHFRASNWFRWYMADQFLESYDWLILVDPDQYVVPECWSPDRFSFLHDILALTDKHVVMRDIFPPQTLNNGFTMLRNSVQGRAFLNLLLDKISWIQTFQHDQGAFDETVLEVVGVVEQAFEQRQFLESFVEGAATTSNALPPSPKMPATSLVEQGQEASAGKTSEQGGSEVENYQPDQMEDLNAWYNGNDLRSFTADFYDSICMPWLFPDANGAHQIAAYSMCWWQNLKEFAGPSGNRSSKVVEFIDPRYVDMNHVVGWRRLESPALLYHFAGPGKNFEDILENFGLERHVTADCRRVYDFVERRMEEKTCVPGNNAVDDIHSFCPPPLVVC